MEFLFFDTSDKLLFVRNDAEQAEHTHEELSLSLVFPYDPAKVIEHKMRVCYRDATGVFVAFEIRKVKNYEPDHYQEITAENIVISDLSDEVILAQEMEGTTAEAALTAVLTGTGWAVGSVSGGTDGKDFAVALGAVWPAIKEIEKNWSVHITPRVTIGSAGITGKYLDITPFEGTFRGLRFALEKNMQDSAVTWDDTKVKTAAYGYGKEVEAEEGEEKSPLTFADVVWTATADHPAKPEGQTYIEDPDAAAEYNRNGRPRFTVFKSDDIDDAEALLQQTWDYLKPLTTPDVSIEGTVDDLLRLGVTNDLQIKLHDMALVQITPTGTILQKQVIRYRENLLNPLDGHITIGDYIPDMVSISVGMGRKLDDLRSYIDLTASHLRIEFEDEINSLRSYVELTASHLRIEFEDGLNSLRSYIELTASYLRAEFEDGLNSLRSYLELTASRLFLEFENFADSMRSYIEMTASRLYLEFDSFSESMRSYIELTASHLTLEFEDFANSMRSYLELTASHLYLEFDDFSASMRSYMELTASHLYLEFDNFSESMRSYLELTASILHLEFINEITSLRSYVEIQADRIDMNVAATDENSSILRQAGMYINDQGVLIYATDNQNNIGSKLNVLSNEISAKVGKSEVTITSDSITIGSDTLSLQGYVLIEDLASEIADITNLEVASLNVSGAVDCGTIRAISADLDTINGQSMDNLSNAVIGFGTASASGGQITIPYTTFGGSGTINFNIADTQYYQDGVAAAAASVDFSSESLWSSGDKTLTLTNGKTHTVSIPNASNWSSTQIGAKSYAVTALVGGKALNTTIDTTGSYNAGAASVSTRTATSAGSVTLSGSDTGSAVSKTTTVTYDNSTSTANVPITINASAVYSAGYTAGAASVVQRTANYIAAGSMSVDSTGKILSGTASVYYNDQTVTSGVSLEVNATAAYNAGWVDGYNAAVSASGKSGNTVTIPTTTSAQGSTPTTSYTAYADVTDTHHIDFPPSIALVPGQTFTGAAGNYVYKNSVTLAGGVVGIVGWS